MDDWFRPFVVIDTETTGTGPTDQITEIGIVRFLVEDFGEAEIFDDKEIHVIKPPKVKVLSEFNSFVRTQLTVSKEITELTGITQEDVKGGLYENDIFDVLRIFIESTPNPIVGFNWPFDRRMLAVSNLSKAKAVGCMKWEAIDPLVVAKEFLKYCKGKNLQHLAEMIGYSYSPHRAREDCVAIALVFTVLMQATFLLNHTPAEVARVIGEWRIRQENDFFDAICRKYGTPPYRQCYRCGVWVITGSFDKHTCEIRDVWPVGPDYPTKQQVEEYEKRLKQVRNT